MAEITREIGLDASEVPTLDESLLTLSDSEQEFLHKAITSDDTTLKEKILEVQRIAYAEHPYPCIRAFHFVNLMMAANPIYPEVLTAGRNDNTALVDVGCCMGSDVRKIVSDGYPAINVLGVDLRQEFLDLGYRLYGPSRDINFFTSDIFEIPYPVPKAAPADDTPFSSVKDLLQLRGRITHFYTGALFHLFDESTQYALALRVAELLKREPGGVVFGRHQGLVEAGYINDHLGRNRYGHSETSWLLLWKKVFSEIESSEFAEQHVVVNAQLTSGFASHIFQARTQTHMLVWSVKLV
ncbi:hypothetical protein BDY19DRAFT_521616 [Irpex rosettiformis]|uniref:Uncharacterized protein n=1 Tax=Irpex rosettiformis TaxID=378272 RepID=A0ACB8TRI2_9APHY|nr:hypothetical protein BDY19DRAFT_521616 [Irpex rosettiformis]